MKYLFFFFFLIPRLFFAQSFVGNDKMKVIYIGVSNPMSVDAVGIPADELELDFGEACHIEYRTKNYFSVRATKPNENAVLNISHKGKVIGKHSFRIRRIPVQEVALLIDDKNEKGGPIAVAKFRTINALISKAENFDFDESCEIQSFSCTRVSRSQNIMSIPNQSGAFNSKLLYLVRTAQIGDTFYFDEIKTRCPGDDAAMVINSMVFTMK